LTKTVLKSLSLFLAVVLLLNMLPLGVMAKKLETQPAQTQVSESAGELSQAEIVAELTENRTAYSKEYLLSNGLHMATVYADPIHYQKDGIWQDIDNTLVTKADGTYTNTAGPWQVTFPQSMTSDRAVTVAKDGYSLSFILEGQVRSSGMSRAAQPVAPAGNTQAALKQPDAILAESGQQDASAPQKLWSRVTYSDVYTDTDVVYDLESNTVKESIILGSYDASLTGYRYTLKTGKLTPVMDDTGHIDLYAPGGKEPVMSMPAPYLLDDKGEYNDDVTVTLTGENGVYTMTYTLPQAWLAAEERAWPVVLDPVVKADIDANNIQDRTLCTLKTISYKKSILYAGYAPDRGKIRGFLRYNELPALTSSDVVVYAQFSMYKVLNSSDNEPVQIRKITGPADWDSQTVTWDTQPSYSDLVTDYTQVKSKGWDYWDITDIVRDWYATGNYGLMLKMSDEVENGTKENMRQFYSSDAGSAYRPTLSIVFRNNNGLESYWDYTSASAGRAGTGYVNNFTGNLVWTRSDMGFGGNRMPVSISHVYNLNDSAVIDDGNNANDSAGNYFGLGNGWRTNYNQLILDWAVTGTTSDDGYYIWEDADGTDIYFKKAATNRYVHEDDSNIVLKPNGSGTKKYTITFSDGSKSYFDTKGRLTMLENNQDTASNIEITYVGDTKQISTVTDGVGREYRFTYTDGLLTRIGYYGSGETELSYITYQYDASGNLTGITDKDGERSTYTYTGKLLTSAEDLDGYKLTYAFNAPTEDYQPYRVMGVEEHYGNTAGGSLSISYSRNQTVFTDHDGNIQIHQFDDFGHTVSIRDDEGRGQFVKYPFFTDSEEEDNSDATKHTNKFSQVSKLQNTVSNLLSNSSFEETDNWSSLQTTAYTVGSTAAQSYLGFKSLGIGGSAGAASPSMTAQAGKTYTFSAYVKTDGTRARIGISMSGNMCYSRYLAPGSDWTRLEVSCEGVDTDFMVVFVETEYSGTTYVDCVQLEEAPTASRYNLVENSDFRSGLTGWTGEGYSLATTADTAAPQLDHTAVTVTGDPDSQRSLTQTVPVFGNEGDTLVLTGWAKGDSVAINENIHDDDRSFGLTGVFVYADGTESDPFPVTFNPDAGSTLYWQFAAAPMVAKQAYTAVKVSVCYDYNMNSASFDGIGLYKEEYGASYTYDADGNVISIVDLEKQETTYEYDENNDLTKIIQGDKIKMTYTYDDWHNVASATTEMGQLYEFTYDAYGNNTSVKTTADGLTMQTTAVYTTDGNRLSSTTDTLGHTTAYEYDANTNMLLWVQYPEDTAESKTVYTYDELYRVATAQGTDGGSNTLSAAYTYDNDRLTKVQTPTTAYTFTYGDFGLRSSVKAGSYTLASYSYTDDRNNYLASITYGNNDSVAYDYDDKGRLTKQTYEDGDTVTYAYDNTGALASVTDSATGVTTKYYYDFTSRLLAYEEAGNGHSLRVGYSYDIHNNLTGLTQTVNGVERISSYTYDDDNRVTSVTADGVTVEYTYDALGRVSQQVTKQGETTVLTESFTYTTVNGNTSAQIATYTTVTAAGTTTYSYTYDGNGNILSVSDGTNTTSYVYDKQNQLIRENNQAGGFTHTWQYDNAGNIQIRTEYAYTTGTLGTPTDTVTYTYADESWGDLLTAYDGASITYDGIGNPNALDGWSFTWEHGRELVTMSNSTTTWTNTYNADGLRTKRTNGTTTYSYVYTGSSLLSMTVGSNTLYFNYDAAGTPLTVTYNGTTYYYATNLQGDIAAILDSTGTAVVSYTYDAWGNPISTTGTLATTLGQYNPLRYRGYVYDTETGLYYLQSRYYNPKVGRFVSEDITVSTGQRFVGCNMFVYCINNPMNYVDSRGTDAIWIQESESVYTLGHTGLLVEDADGKWYFFYWGSDPNAEDPGLFQKLIDGEPAKYIWQEIKTDGYNLFTTDGVKEALSNSKGMAASRSDKVTDIIYFVGDYTNTSEYIIDLGSSNEKYNRIQNNCVQQTIKALSKSDPRIIIANDMIPNVAYENVKRMYPPLKSAIFWIVNAIINGGSLG